MCLYFDSLRYSYLICDVTNLIISSKIFKGIFEQKSFSCLTRTEKVPINEVLQDFVTLKYKTNMPRITAVGSPKGGGGRRGEGGQDGGFCHQTRN